MSNDEKMSKVEELANGADVAEDCEYPGLWIASDGETIIDASGDEPREITPIGHPAGYRRVTYGGVCHYVHHVVLRAFVGPCPEGQMTRHLNDIPHDNRVENLRWGTKSQNERDKRRNGNCHWAVLTPRQVLVAKAIRARCGWTYRQLADRMGVHQSTIARAVKGETWAG